ncbi:16S rRNA (cytidine(1402)-2'-O)-methyltransferase [Pseudothermotoga thermarum]|nr:16S rRNA (cytidine(1402)-2'-O)-methyltransferase [Pseudothermotoga thermarum]
MMDITIRAIKALKSADVILAEDTRRTMKLLKFFRIEGKPVYSYGAHNETKSIPMILKMLNEGKTICLVTDSGMPCVSDPGALLVDACWRKGIELDVMPGPSALTSALALCGFDTSKVYFVGFLPRGKKRRKLLREVKGKKGVLVFFEAPIRIAATLKDILEIIGDNEIFIAREMTKVFQQLYRGKVSEALQLFKDTKGELTVVLKLQGGRKDEGKSREDH